MAQNSSMPLPQSIPVLALPTAIDYTSKDYTGFVQSMMAFAAQVFPDWQPTSEGDFGVVMVELLAMCLDVLSYYGDRISQEAYLPTATSRTSLLNISQLLGYIPSNGSPATGTVTFAVSSPVTGATSVIDIPAGTQVSTPFSSAIDSPVVYQTTADCTVPLSGSSTTTVAVKQGITYGTVASPIVLGQSNAQPGQSFQIPVTGVQDGATKVYVQTSSGYVQWQQIQYLVDAAADQTVFSIWVDQNGLTNINFGDNINGAIPGLGLNIAVVYTVIAGTAGNCNAGVVNTLVSNISNVTIAQGAGGPGTYASSAMSGGADAETNDQIRANAPAAFQTQFRAVSPADFASLALSVPGVMLAQAAANHSTSVTLYILGPGYTTPSTGLQNNVLAYFQGKTLAGVSLNVASPSLIAVNVGSLTQAVTIQVLPNYYQASVENAVIAALQNLLSAPAQGFGALLNVSDIYQAILAVAGVAYCVVPVFSRTDNVQTLPNPIQFRPSEIPQPGQFYLTMSGGIT